MKSFEDNTSVQTRGLYPWWHDYWYSLNLS